MSVISHISISPANFEMRHPFVTHLGSKSETKNLVIEVGLRSGVIGRGEASASLALPQETQANMGEWLKKIVPAFIGQPIHNVQPLAQSPLYRELLLDGHPTALGALETALLDAHAQSLKRPLASFFGGKRAPIETDITLSAWPLPLTLRVARQYAKQGFHRFKVKVGKTRLEADLERLKALAHEFPRHLLWVDANQGWSVADVKKFDAHAARENWRVVALEQPTRKFDLDALKRAQTASRYPIFADESAGSVAMLEKIIQKKAARGVVVKVAKAGLAESLEMVRLAREEGLLTMISCMAESGEGLNLSVQWAIGDGRFDWVDLDSFTLTRSPQRRPFAAKGSQLSLLRRPPQKPAPARL